MRTIFCALLSLFISACATAQTGIRLLYTSAASASQYDVVCLGSSANTMVKSTSALQANVLGTLTGAATQNTQQVAYLRGSYAKVNVTGNVAVGDLLVTSSTAGKARASANDSEDTAAFAIATSAVTGGGTADAVLTTLAEGSGNGSFPLDLTGDVTGSGSDTIATTIANDAVTYAKMQNVSATDKVLGRATSGSGDVEEIAFTPAMRSVADDTSVSAMIDTLGGASATGTGGLVRLNTPTLITPNLGEATATGLTITDGAGISLLRSPVYMTNDDNANMISMTGLFNDSSTRNLILLSAARGEVGAPTIVQASDVISQMSSRGYDGSAYRTNTVIETYVDGTPGSNDMPGGLRVKVAADGGTTLATAMDIRQDKSVAFSGPISATNVSGTNTGDESVMVGDSGSGGTAGLVPAPAAGDTAAGKFLKANGTWAAAGTGDVVGPSSATDNRVARYDGSTGKLLQNSTVGISDDGDITGVRALTTTNGNWSLSRDTQATVEIYSAQNGISAHSTISGYAASGTIASPTDVVDGTPLLTLTGTGYYGAGYTTFPGGLIRFLVSSAPSGGDSVPTEIVFGVSNASGDLNPDAMTLDEDGNLRLEADAYVDSVYAGGELVTQNEAGGFVGLGGAAGSAIISQQSNGTLASPTITADADELLTIAAQGHDGTDYVTGGFMRFDALGTPTTGYVGAEWTLFLSDTSTGFNPVIHATHDDVEVNAPVSVTGDLILTTAGNGLQVKTGSNATAGKATLTGGTVTVSTTKVTANSLIFLTHQNNSGTVGSPSVSARTAGTSFVITSTSASDTSDVAWFIVEPAS